MDLDSAGGCKQGIISTGLKNRENKVRILMCLFPSLTGSVPFLSHYISSTALRSQIAVFKGLLFSENVLTKLSE